jgi:hypothetical protein
MEKVQLVFIITKMTYGRLEDFLEAPVSSTDISVHYVIQLLPS